MTREEMLRILRFMKKTNGILASQTELAATDARWNILSFAMERHLEGKLLTITSAAMAADVPYGTAMRRINELFEEGWLMKRPKSKTGKSFSLHPTRKLIAEYESFAMQFKTVIGETFGFSAEDDKEPDFYFGGAYLASRILPYPNAMRSGLGYDRKFRILCPIDPTFRTLGENEASLRELTGTNIEVINLPLEELHAKIFESASAPRPQFDLIALDLPWIGELVEQQVISPLDDILQAEKFNPLDFHAIAYHACNWNGSQYALPLQPTVELLFCRKDIFANAGLKIPKSLDELLVAAKTLHKSQKDLAGIVMNYGRGTPVAHSFIQTLADFGQAFIDLDALEHGYNVGSIHGENYRPCLDSEGARAAAEYMLEILDFAHSESLRCNWDKRIEIFSKGQAAMTYGWSVRAAKFETDPKTAAHGKVAFAPHPAGRGLESVSPIGGYALAIPSNLSDVQKRQSWKILEYLSRPELMKWYVQNGSMSSPRYSTSADPEVQAKSGVIGVVDRLAREGKIQVWPRPPITEFTSIVNILGDEIYLMLQGQQTVKAALTRAQNAIDSLMRKRGHY